MTESELLQILARGEDSSHQFKRNLANPEGVAAELFRGSLSSDSPPGRRNEAQ